MSKVIAVAVTMMSLAVLTLTFKTIDVPGPLAVNGTFVDGITDLGEIVGNTIDGAPGPAGPYEHGFLMARDGKITTLDAPFPEANCGTYTAGINFQGDITGGYFVGDADCNSTTYGYVRSKDGTWTKLDFPGATNTFMGGINSLGETTGTYCTDADCNYFHGFLFRPGFGCGPGTYLSFDYPASFGTEGYGINDAGDIVGDYYDASGNGHGFLLHEGTFTTIEPVSLGAVGSVARGINLFGEIVGVWNGSHGFIFTHGTYTPLDMPGATGTHTRALNDEGVIVGYYDDSAGLAHGFEAKPSR
ncbi:MAG TPA: hypothetical protein VMK12_29675 [Anaeromyxobacteraceae bacterium]|nr:hypothetical protein [Anaeromyxobacteraceae bacterium]